MLLETYGASNRVIDKGLAITKDRQRVLGSWTGTTVVASGASVTYGSMWRSTRTATMTYRYVGMTQDAANACASDMAEYWTRSTTVSTWDGTAGDMGDWLTVNGGYVLMASISVVKSGDGKMYEVEIEVNERDEKWSKSNTAASWALEDAREYDGGEGD